MFYRKLKQKSVLRLFSMEEKVGISAEFCIKLNIEGKGSFLNVLKFRLDLFYYFIAFLNLNWSRDSTGMNFIGFHAF